LAGESKRAGRYRLTLTGAQAPEPGGGMMDSPQELERLRESNAKAWELVKIMSETQITMANSICELRECNATLKKQLQELNGVIPSPDMWDVADIMREIDDMTKWQHNHQQRG
jgi:hypothetical protein